MYVLARHVSSSSSATDGGVDCESTSIASRRDDDKLSTEGRRIASTGKDCRCCGNCDKRDCQRQYAVFLACRLLPRVQAKNRRALNSRSREKIRRIKHTRRLLLISILLAAESEVVLVRASLRKTSSSSSGLSECRGAFRRLCRGLRAGRPS